MEDEEQLRSFMFLMTYLLLKRRRDVSSADAQRRSEIQRRIRHRQYFFQRQRRMLMVSPPCLTCVPLCHCTYNSCWTLLYLTHEGKKYKYSTSTKDIDKEAIAENSGRYYYRINTQHSSQTQGGLVWGMKNIKQQQKNNNNKNKHKKTIWATTR